MKKRGLIGKIILGIFGFLLIIGLGAGIYFYNFHVFKEIRICVGGGENTMIPCNTREDCINVMREADLDFSVLDGAPDFIVKNFNDILESAVYCEESCFVGNVRGIDYESGEIEGLESCLDGEEEFVMEIHGKEGIEILKWMKSQN
jgi:hypothetical protein